MLLIGDLTRRSWAACCQLRTKVYTVENKLQTSFDETVSSHIIQDTVLLTNYKYTLW